MKFLFFDTESTDLSASWGRILCCSYADMTGEVYTHRGDSKPRRGREPHHTYYPGQETVDDSALVVAIRDELESADIIVGWNSILHDIPLLNARLQVAGERPYCGKTWPRGSHLDLMYYATASALKVGGKSLKRISEFFGLENQKTPLLGTDWQRAAVGERDAMDVVVEHCEADVLVLRETFPILAQHVKKLVLPMSKWWMYADDIEL